MNTEALLTILADQNIDIVQLKALAKGGGGAIFFGLGLKGVLQLRGMSKEEGEHLAKYRRLRDRSWFQLVVGALLLYLGIASLFI